MEIPFWESASRTSSYPIVRLRGRKDGNEKNRRHDEIFYDPQQVKCSTYRDFALERALPCNAQNTHNYTWQR